MSNELLKNVLQEMCDEEFAEYETSEEHKFSLRHRRKMKKLFREFDKKYALDISEKKTTQPRRRIAAVVIAATIFLVSCVTVGALTIGFRYIQKSDHTEIFNIDYENAPLTIEYLYYISDLPEEYKLIDSDVNIDLSADFFYETEDGRIFKFNQVVKSVYKSYINTERYKMEEIIIDNKNGVYIAFENESLLVWDNGDYVLEIYSDLTKDNMIDLAKSAKIMEF